MSDLPPDLAALAKTLKQVFTMHIRGRTSVMGYRIVDAAGKTVGAKAVSTTKGKQTVTFTLGDDQFAGAESFLKAYQQMLRDVEWESAAPKEKTT